MEIKNLSLDLETKSSVDISKAGAYKYAESPDFEILLFGVSVNHGPITVYDLPCGDTVPEEIIAALSDDRVTKWAYNASFERVCLSVWLRRNYPEHFLSYSIPGDPVQNYLDPNHGNAHWSGLHTTVCRWAWRRLVRFSASRSRNSKKART